MKRPYTSAIKPIRSILNLNDPKAIKEILNAPVTEHPDKISLALKPGTLTAVLGQKGMECTTLAVKNALCLAKKRKKVVFITWEKIDVLRKIITATTGKETDNRSLQKTTEEIVKTGIHINTSPVFSVKDVRNSLKKFSNPDALLIDNFENLYFRNLPFSKKKDSPEERKAFCLSLKRLAKSLHIPVLVFGRLKSRKIKNCSLPRPRILDMGTFPFFEDIADRLFLIYRPEYYGIEDKVIRE